MSKHMIIFGVTWNVEKCLYARDPLVCQGSPGGFRGGNPSKGPKHGSSIDERGTT